MKTRLPVLLLLALSFLLLFSAAEASTLTLPSGITSIAAQAFMNDTSLDRVVLPEGIKTIGSEAFAYSSVTRINLPSTLTSIAHNAFDGCEVYVTAKKGSYAYDWAVDRYWLPAIVYQPEDVTVWEYKPFRLYVYASGTDVSYQWQYSTDNGSTWKDSTITGSTSPALETNAYATYNNRRYRCRITDAFGHSITSQSAKLTVKSDPEIITHPFTFIADEHTSFSFSVEAGGIGNLTYQWQYRESETASWKNWTTGSCTSAVLEDQARYLCNGYFFRCKVTDSNGKNVSSDEAMLFVVQQTEYRALLIAETSFYERKGNSTYGFQDVNRNALSLSLMKNLLESVCGPTGGQYTYYDEMDVGYDRIKELIQGIFADTDDDDVSLFFIATHGFATTKDDEGHIIARENGDLQMPFLGTEEEMNVSENRRDYKWKDWDGVVRTHTEYLPFSTLASWLKTYVKGKVIVILQACGSGAAIWESDLEQNGPEEGTAVSSISYDPAAWTNRAVSAFSAADPGIRSAETGEFEANTGEFRVLNKFYVLASSRYGENSYGYNSMGSHFIICLSDGVGSKGNMPADTNNDGTADLAELYNYIRQFDGQGKYNDWYEEKTQHVQRYPASGTGSTYPLFMFR